MSPKATKAMIWGAVGVSVIAVLVIVTKATKTKAPASYVPAGTSPLNLSNAGSAGPRPGTFTGIPATGSPAQDFYLGQSMD